MIERIVKFWTSLGAGTRASLILALPVVVIALFVVALYTAPDSVVDILLKVACVGASVFGLYYLGKGVKVVHDIIKYDIETKDEERKWRKELEDIKRKLDED